MKLPRKIFVTGATGFVGGHFLRLAKEKEWNLRCLFRKGTPPSGKGIEWIRGDLRREGPWVKALKDCQAVVHLATVPLNECEKNPSGAREAILGGTRRLLKAAKQAGIKRCVVVSTSEVYGSPRRLPIGERAALKPLSTYGRLKAAADRAAIRWGRQDGNSLCLLRFFNLYGCRCDGSSPRNFIRLFVEALAREEPIVLHRSIRNSRDLLHVRDAARAVELALERPAAKGIFNICSGRETPLVEVARRLARLARWQARLKIDLRPSEGRLRRICGDPRLARRALGFRPNISLDDGLREVLRRTERSE